ncbi:MAG: hypothetical protein H6553_12090 [Chitinophagales bacterium]|nr:hypothetical protein [Chitinophagales bacterium]
MKNYFSILLFSCVLLFSSCNKAKKECPGAKKATLKDFTGFDGCTWIIQLEDGTYLEPKNLDKFNITLEDNKKVWIRYETQMGASICMVGDIVNLLCITER